MCVSWYYGDEYLDLIVDQINVKFSLRLPYNYGDEL